MTDRAKARKKQASAELSLKALMKTKTKIKVLLTKQATNGAFFLNESISVVLQLRNLESHH
jgi:hypothetical protein